MGANQSRPSDAAINEKLIERLQALHMKDERPMNEKDGYIVVGGEAPSKYTPGAKHHQDVSAASIGEWERELMEDPKNRLALAALSSNPANAVLSSRSATISDTQNFNIKIPVEGSPVTNQASSGRCWLFAATNVFRIAIMKKHKLSEFQLSQAYLFYWDKIEKANYFLESILDTKTEEIDSRIVQALMASPVGDGGQWDMVANLVQKYGLVPQSLYPDSYNATNSSTMDRLITTKLREDAVRLRSIATSATSPEVIQATIATEKEKMLREIHLILTLMLGPPPPSDKAFTWEYYDKDGNLCTLRTRPTAFAKELSDNKTVRALSGTDVHQLFSLVNDPRNPYNRLLSVKRLGNVWNGRPVTYVNVDMKIIKEACIATLKRGIPVFFGSDVGKYSDSTKGIMDTNLFEYELGFNIKLGLSKAERLQTGESQMTHAMVLTAVHVVDGKPVRWRVENSWSDRVGDKGYFVMSDAWMDQFVYQVVVDPSVVNATIRKVLGQKPKMLELWDPMGALA
ncbi:peptidase C1B, bleomycin hydrolase [Cucurbitaria berberidis CBS 394.84]|uniref:Cysteine proteinase 1, mitochondrial n=1 Tax=Cucurbitaria berberidis CBS 394.84 TaxID=1168544 RepID=A0A9P4L8M9_9PLEO|nr:peptidase C1B, bleomycin hydrolase [Cucurbitaria berberidis CBS 394.84]KAF1845497.1 peptidase C1B, bleomycin hydrolase [Cucurbitaria berberidis CBS 394.84]